MTSAAQVSHTNRPNAYESTSSSRGRDLAEREAGGPDLVLGRIVAEGFYRDQILDHLLMYERRIEQSLYRTMDQLPRKQRLMREAGDDCATHGRDGRATDGRDAHATEPKGGTPNGDGNESCETNPIRTGSNAGGAPNGSCETNPICGGSNVGTAQRGTEPGANVRNETQFATAGMTDKFLVAQEL